MGELSSFQMAVVRNTQTVFLGQGHFEEQVSYQMTTQQQPVTMVVLSTNSDGGMERETHHLADGRRFTFLTAVDPVIVLADGTRTCWSAVYGEAFTPRIGHSFERQDGTKWAFDRVVQSDFAGMTLQFKRQDIVKAGTRPGNF